MLAEMGRSGTMHTLAIVLLFLPFVSLQVVTRSVPTGSGPTSSALPPTQTGTPARTGQTGLPTTNSQSPPPTPIMTIDALNDTINETDVNATAAATLTVTLTVTVTEAPTTLPNSCRRGFWGDWCQHRCKCNSQPCNRTGACLCGPCFTGPTCNDTSDGGRQCVQDIFNARKPADVKGVIERVGRAPRTLAQPDRVALFAGFAKTSVNNIGDTKYEVLTKPGGKELIQLKAVIADKTAREVICSSVKDGSIGATCIEHNAERTIYLNKPTEPVET